MSASFELIVDLTQLRPHPLRDGDTPQPEPSLPRLATQMCEAEEVERFRLPEAPRCSPGGSVPPELDQSGLAIPGLAPSRGQALSTARFLVSAAPPVLIRWGSRLFPDRHLGPAAVLLVAVVLVRPLRVALALPRVSARRVAARAVARVLVRQAVA